MHIWTQNLNEKNGQPVGSILFYGRGHVSRKPWKGVKWGAEWRFLHKVRWDCGISFHFGHGESNNGLMLVLKMPWICALYFYVDGVMQPRKEERSFDFTYFDNRLRLSLWSREFEYRSDDPWWIRGIGFDMPWTPIWVYTRIYDHDQKEIVFEENFKARRRDMMKQELAARDAHSRKYPYRYVLKNSDVQECTASVCVEERAWGYKWWRRPVNVRRSISVNFNAEVGEGTGSWKGGCVGCGYDMLPGESAEQCLRRMEKERTFDR